MRSLRQKCSSLLFSASAREASERFQLSQELLLATASRWMSSAGPSSALISEEAVALAVQANRDALEDVLRSLETSVPGPSSRPSVVDWLDPTRHHDVSYSFKRYSELEQAAGRVSAALRGAKIRGGISPGKIPTSSLSAVSTTYLLVDLFIEKNARSPGSETLEN